MVSSRLASLAFLISVTVVNAVSNGHCTETILPLSIIANNTEIKLSAPRSQMEVSDLVTRISSLTSNLTSEIVGGPRVNNATYRIWTQLCVPTKPDASKTVELAVHGAGFDHSYWNFGGDGSKYNYVEAVLKAGHSILIYDRLGTGQSDKPDGITEVQSPTEIEIAAQLVKYLRGSPKGNQFKRVIGIGHSFGSATLLGLVSKYGDVLDATILTGFAVAGGINYISYPAIGWTIASVQNPKRFGALPSSYVVSEGVSNSQHFFFHYGGYETAILNAAEAMKSTATLGELFVQLGAPALSYTKPVFVVTGDKDFAVCTGNCYQKFNGVNIVEATKQVFPAVAADKFSTWIPATTGHATNLHLSAPETYGKIQEWIGKL
ncbi:Alpha/Beta hydrolase protein [Ephemerocybe angulata]|uniref:Alpha/Beta hydrolase protein n=1 Tax=Ephemerocybe angulata TaxID=980116 RepID=A0A8H6HMG6_9AGAR|nr:Alpha/Beta hydrolase protein [Tulosesus angulatus]